MERGVDACKWSCNIWPRHQGPLPVRDIQIAAADAKEIVAMNEHGWISHGEGDNSHLTDEERRMVEERIRERQEQRGGLLGVVEVNVYEHGCDPQVSFPHGSLLGVEADASVIAEIVARASAELANWP